jgi:hypothetical protein
VVKLRVHKRRSYRSGPPGGAEHPLAKLTDADVVLMRGLYWVEGMSVRLIAVKFEVSIATAYNALVGNTWPHVPMPPGRSVIRH